MSSETILIDTRQPPWMARKLEAMGLSVVVKPLPSGDFAWSAERFGMVGVEDKTLTGLLGDHRTGVLDDQLRRLCEDYALPILLIRGLPVVKGGQLSFWSWTEQERLGGWSHVALDNMLVGRQLRGIVVAWAATSGVAIERLLALYRYTRESAPGGPDRPPRAYLPWMGPLTGRAEVFYAILRQVPNLRNRRELATRLAAEATLTDLLTWGEAEYREKLGVTKLMAGRLAAAIQELR